MRWHGSVLVPTDDSSATLCTGRPYGAEGGLIGTAFIVGFLATFAWGAISTPRSPGGHPSVPWQLTPPVRRAAHSLAALGRPSALIMNQPDSDGWRLQAVKLSMEAPRYRMANTASTRRSPPKLPSKRLRGLLAYRSPFRGLVPPSSPTLGRRSKLPPNRCPAFQVGHTERSWNSARSSRL